MVDYSIVLIGFMGTGKSTIANRLSKELNLELIDTDKLIEKKAEMTIPEIFERYGEERFREIEEDIIKELKDKKNSVISCGGGVCLRDENIKNIKSRNKVILLESSGKVVLERIKGDLNRPVLKEKMDVESIEKIMNIRKSNYYKAADIIIDTNEKTIIEIIDEILRNIKL